MFSAAHRRKGKRGSTAGRDQPSTTTTCGANSPQTDPTRCGSRTSPNTEPGGERQALLLRDQGRIQRADRRVLARLADEGPVGGERPRGRREPTRELDRGDRAFGPRQSVPQSTLPASAAPTSLARFDGARRGVCGQRRDGELVQPAPEERPQPAALGHPRLTPPRDRALDRSALPPPPSTTPTREVDPHRVRSNHERYRHPAGIRKRVNQTFSIPFFLVCYAVRDCTFNGVTPIREVHHEHAG